MPTKYCVCFISLDGVVWCPLTCARVRWEELKCQDTLTHHTNQPHICSRHGNALLPLCQVFCCISMDGVITLKNTETTPVSWMGPEDN